MVSHGQVELLPLFFFSPSLLTPSISLKKLVVYELLGLRFFRLKCSVLPPFSSPPRGPLNVFPFFFFPLSTPKTAKEVRDSFLQYLLSSLRSFEV